MSVFMGWDDYKLKIFGCVFLTTLYLYFIYLIQVQLTLYNLFFIRRWAFAINAFDIDGHRPRSVGLYLANRVWSHFALEPNRPLSGLLRAPGHLGAPFNVQIAFARSIEISRIGSIIIQTTAYHAFLRCLYVAFRLYFGVHHTSNSSRPLYCCTHYGVVRSWLLPILCLAKLLRCAEHHTKRPSSPGGAITHHSCALAEAATIRSSWLIVATAPLEAGLV